LRLIRSEGWTGGEGEEVEKVNLKICLAGELNPGLQRERPFGPNPAQISIPVP
jgi:hypothetical protein